MQERDGRFSDGTNAHRVGEPRAERAHDAGMRDRVQDASVKRFARHIDCEGPPAAPARRAPHGRGPRDR